MKTNICIDSPDFFIKLSNLLDGAGRSVCFPALTRSHMCVCFSMLRTSSAVSSEPICAVNPCLQAPRANETFPDREWFPPVLCARPNQYSSCKTYFTEMAPSQQVVEGKERDLSITHWYLWLVRCQGILMERVATPLLFSHTFKFSRTDNHYSVICGSEHRSIRFQSGLYLFASLSSFLAGEPRHLLL